MLPDIRRTGDRFTAALCQGVRQFEERVVVHAVPVDDADRRSVLRFDRVQSFGQDGRHPSHVHRHADHEQVVFRCPQRSFFRLRSGDVDSSTLPWSIPRGNPWITVLVAPVGEKETSFTDSMLICSPPCDPWMRSS
jgi:hypothetical protein